MPFVGSMRQELEMRPHAQEDTDVWASDVISVPSPGICFARAACFSETTGGGGETCDVEWSGSCLYTPCPNHPNYADGSAGTGAHRPMLTPMDNTLSALYQVTRNWLTGTKGTPAMQRVIRIKYGRNRDREVDLFDINEAAWPACRETSASSSWEFQE